METFLAFKVHAEREEEEIKERENTRQRGRDEYHHFGRKK